MGIDLPTFCLSLVEGCVQSVNSRNSILSYGKAKSTPEAGIRQGVAGALISFLQVESECRVPASAMTSQSLATVQVSALGIRHIQASH